MSTREVVTTIFTCVASVVVLWFVRPAAAIVMSAIFLVALGVAVWAMKDPNS